MQMSEDRIKALQVAFGLTYHVSNALHAETLVGLRGKDVLEVGGSLPANFVLGEIGARRWFSIEEMEYWRESTATGHTQGTPPVQTFAGPLSVVTDISVLGAHAVFDGRIERLPSSLHGCFDVIFSIAAFEHIDRMPLALDAMFKALRPGGAVFSMYSPIWSAHDGHHLPTIIDAQGHRFDFSSSPIPRWGHLTMRPPELHQYLLKHTDPATASEIVYYVYHSPHINRLFTEDYITFFHKSSFVVEKMLLTFPFQGPAELLEKAQKTLEGLYPGRRHFLNNGILVVLRKPS
jgi:SAM-dependent methyltransferase